MKINGLSCYVGLLPEKVPCWGYDANEWYRYAKGLDQKAVQSLMRPDGLNLLSINKQQGTDVR